MTCGVELGAVERMVELGDVVEEEAGTGGVWLDDEGPVLELIEVLLDVLIAGLGLHLDGWEWDRASGSSCLRVRCES